MNKPTLDGCPWCGEPPEMMPWHGGGPRKRLIACENLECPVNPSVAGSTPSIAARRWNTRRLKEETK